MSGRPVLTRRDFVDQLRSLGIAPGALLMVHGSFRKLGLARATFGDGGAEVPILDALADAIGPDGTLLMTMGTDYPLDRVNERPIEQRAALLAGTAPFRFEDAPVNRRLAGWRSLSAAARDPRQRQSERPLRRRRRAGGGIARRSALGRLLWPRFAFAKILRLGGRVLRLGAGLDTVTALHYANIWPRSRTKDGPAGILLAGASGAEHVWITCLDDSQGIADCDGEDYFAAILKDYFRRKRHREGPVGAATAESMRRIWWSSAHAGWKNTKRPSVSRANVRGRPRRLRTLCDRKPRREGAARRGFRRPARMSCPLRARRTRRAPPAASSWARVIASTRP